MGNVLANSAPYFQILAQYPVLFVLALVLVVLDLGPVLVVIFPTHFRPASAPYN